MLADIVADETVDADLRTIAGAIASIEHQVPEADKAKLQAIVDDPTATEAETTLAAALLRFNHQAAAEDATALRALTE